MEIRYLLPSFNLFDFNRLATFATSQRLAEIHVPSHVFVFCCIKGQLVVYLTIKIVGFSDKLALVVIGASTAIPTIRSPTPEFWSDKRL